MPVFEVPAQEDLPAPKHWLHFFSWTSHSDEKCSWLRGSARPSRKEKVFRCETPRTCSHSCLTHDRCFFRGFEICIYGSRLLLLTLELRENIQRKCLISHLSSQAECVCFWSSTGLNCTFDSPTRLCFVVKPLSFYSHRTFSCLLRHPKTGNYAATMQDPGRPSG